MKGERIKQMGKVVFSSWSRDLKDCRNQPMEKWPEAEEIGLPSSLANENLKAIVGWDGLVVYDPDLDVVEAVREYFQRVQEESCGRCIPCRVGTAMIARVMEKIVQGSGKEEDLDNLQRWGKVVQDASYCELGQSSTKPLLDALQHYPEEFKARVAADDEEETQNEVPAPPSYTYHSTVTAPCLNGCPAHVDIPCYLGNIREGHFEDSLATIREKTALAGSLGRVCVHPCEENCRRLQLDEPVSIRNLKRFVADFEIDLDRDPPEEAYRQEASRDGKIAVIGAGPAGLSAAYQLAQLGYSVTIFEKLPVAGGMLAVGIPAYRLPREILNREVELVKKAGVEIKYNTAVGEDVTFDSLKKDGFQGIFIAAGLHESANMRVEGEDAGYKGFIPGVKFLRNISLGEKMDDMGERIAVIGGGNVAIDCARSSLRQGAKEVYIVYRRSRSEMPAHDVEIEDAEEEGVKYLLLANPSKILAEGGKVTGLECIRMQLGEPDESGRRRPVPIEGSEFVLDVDTIVPAIGQVPDFSFITDDSGVEMDKWGNIKADPVTMETSAPGVFAGGDAVLGAATVIEAIATGNKAAYYMDQYLQQGKIEIKQEDLMQQLLDEMKVYDEEENVDQPAGLCRELEPYQSVESRIKDFSEVGQGLSNTQSLVESERCLRCYRVLLAVTGNK